MNERILVTGAEERSTLAVCRTVAAGGYRVGAVAGERPAPTHWSRSCSERYLLPDARADPDAFVDGLAGILRDTPYAALVPSTDAALLAVSGRRDRLPETTQLGLPSHEAVETATDKIALDAAAAVVGLPSPETAVCHTPEEGLAAARRLGLPLVIKPRRTVYEEDGQFKQRGGAFVADEAEFAEKVRGFGSPYLLQRLQHGEVHSAAGVITPEGEVLSFSASRYVRTWPPEAGSVAYAITIDPPGGLRERVGHLLGELGWFGIFELELIYAPDGSYHAIDLNPRPYGSLAHASAAGAPHARVFIDWLLGRKPAPSTALAGVRYRWEDADLRHALWLARNGRRREATIALRPHAGVVHAHFRRDDPGPLVARALLLARHQVP
jgi:predicted ATP-grasp superfamily ATP-dependent carboligase